MVHIIPFHSWTCCNNDPSLIYSDVHFSEWTLDHDVKCICNTVNLRISPEHSSHTWSATVLTSGCGHVHSVQTLYLHWLRQMVQIKKELLGLKRGDSAKNPWSTQVSVTLFTLSLKAQDYLEWITSPDSGHLLVHYCTERNGTLSSLRVSREQRAQSWDT